MSENWYYTYCLSWEESPSVRKTGWLDIWLNVKRNIAVDLQHRDVVLQGAAVVAGMLLDTLDWPDEGHDLVLGVEGGVSNLELQVGGRHSVSAVSGGDDVLGPHESSATSLPVQSVPVEEHGHLVRDLLFECD